MSECIVDYDDDDEDYYDEMIALVAHRSNRCGLMPTRVLRRSGGADGLGSWELRLILGVEVTVGLAGAGQGFGTVGLGDWAGGCSPPVGVR